MRAKNRCSCQDESASGRCATRAPDAPLFAQRHQRQRTDCKWRRPERIHVAASRGCPHRGSYIREQSFERLQVGSSALIRGQISGGDLVCDPMSTSTEWGRHRNPHEGRDSIVRHYGLRLSPRATVAGLSECNSSAKRCSSHGIPARTRELRFDGQNASPAVLDLPSTREMSRHRSAWAEEALPARMMTSKKWDCA